jgi:hypothetical protein
VVLTNETALLVLAATGLTVAGLTVKLFLDLVRGKAD